MSTVRFRRRTTADMGQAWRPCDTGCRASSGTDIGRNAGSTEMLIMGRGAGFYCDPCVRKLRVAWTENGGGTIPAAKEKMDWSVSRSTRKVAA